VTCCIFPADRVTRCSYHFFPELNVKGRLGFYTTRFRKARNRRESSRKLQLTIIFPYQRRACYYRRIPDFSACTPTVQLLWGAAKGILEARAKGSGEKNPKKKIFRAYIPHNRICLELPLLPKRWNCQKAASQSPGYHSLPPDKRPCPSLRAWWHVEVRKDYEEIVFIRMKPENSFANFLPRHIIDVPSELSHCNSPRFHDRIHCELAKGDYPPLL